MNARAARLGDATPLHLAAAVGAEAAASELLVAYAGPFDGRADVSAPMAGGIQPLHLAAWSAAGLVTELLRERAPADARTAAGLTALDVAALSGQAACVAILLKAGGGAAAGDAPLTAPTAPPSTAAPTASARSLTRCRRSHRRARRAACSRRTAAPSPTTPTASPPSSPPAPTPTPPTTTG